MNFKTKLHYINKSPRPVYFMTSNNEINRIIKDSCNNALGLEPDYLISYESLIAIWSTMIFKIAIKHDLSVDREECEAYAKLLFPCFLARCNDRAFILLLNMGLSMHYCDISSGLISPFFTWRFGFHFNNICENQASDKDVLKQKRKEIMTLCYRHPSIKEMKDFIYFMSNKE